MRLGRNFNEISADIYLDKMEFVNPDYKHINHLSNEIIVDFFDAEWICDLRL